MNIAVKLGGDTYRVAQASPERIALALRNMLARLTLANIRYLKAHPDTPELYRSGVFYQREPEGEEVWQTIPEVRRQGFGDCEDLSCWRAAELRVRGEKAKAIARGRHRGDHVMYHVVVQRADGSIEDPSRRLGM